MLELLRQWLHGSLMRESTSVSLILSGVLMTAAICIPPAAAAENKRELLARNTGAFALPGSATFDVKSSRGRPYRVFVWLPDGAAPQSGFPLLVTLDANVYFAAAVSALQAMAPVNPALRLDTNTVKPMMVVGMGYHGDMLNALKERAFDYLPALTALDTTLPREGWKGQPPGGADQFLSFLLDELRPALARRYSIDPQHQTLMGHSLGGFFALFALAKRPEAFRNYVAISPSLWWDENRLVSETGEASPLAAQGPTHHVLLAMARDEEPGVGDVSEIMRRLGQTMSTNLNRWGNGRVQTRYVEVPDEDHQSTQVAMMSAVLRAASQ